jgi:ATP-dependent Clp protease protease subunit
MSYHTGKPLEVIEHDTERDFFLTAEQAVDYGLVEHVMQIPDFKNI